MFRLLIIVAFTVLSFALSGPALAQNFDVDEMLKKAQSGDAVAQYTIGVAYWAGDGLPAKKDEAAKWAKKAAEQGHVTAQYILGSLYWHGEGVPENKDEAIKWYTKAAARGSVGSIVALRDMYDKGLGVPENKDEAKKWADKTRYLRCGTHEANFSDFKKVLPGDIAQ